jgi:hypothetical protein
MLGNEADIVITVSFDFPHNSNHVPTFIYTIYPE